MYIKPFMAKEAKPIFAYSQKTAVNDIKESGNCTIARCPKGIVSFSAAKKIIKVAIKIHGNIGVRTS